MIKRNLFIKPISPSDIEIHMDDDIKESSDRLILLAKKYASETANLSKEENARLEMINQRMDLKIPRYSAKDWKLLDEAKTLIGELSSISGTESWVEKEKPTRRYSRFGIPVICINAPKDLRLIDDTPEIQSAWSQPHANYGMISGAEIVSAWFRLLKFSLKALAT